MKIQMDMFHFNEYTYIYLGNVECCARVLEAIYDVTNASHDFVS
jgi:hypothetical protein